MGVVQNAAPIGHPFARAPVGNGVEEDAIHTPAVMYA
jgi:hypothetical protein